MRFISSLVILSIAAAPAAHADELPSAPSSASQSPDGSLSATSPAPTRWYGWQTLTADAVAAAFLPAALVADEHGSAAGGRTATALGVIGVSTYVLGAPIIHKLHQDGWSASLESLGLRVGLPAAAGLVGYLVALPAQNSCNQNNGFICLNTAVGTLLGASIGALGASALDSTLIAHERLPASAQLSVAPIVLPHGSPLAPQGATGVALAARF